MAEQPKPKKPRRPTRMQWVALKCIRDRNSDGKPSLVAGTCSQTNKALERYGWAHWRDRGGWVLTPIGLVAVLAGDRRFGPCVPQHSEALIAFVEANKEP